MLEARHLGRADVKKDSAAGRGAIEQQGELLAELLGLVAPARGLFSNSITLAA